MKRLVAAVVLLAALPVNAQQTVATATVTGRLMDGQGAPLKGVAVELVQTDTNRRQTTATDARGRFRFSSIPVGPYELAFEKDGFAGVRRSFRAAAGQSLDIPVLLFVAGKSEAVTVLAAPLVETVRTQIAETVTSEEIKSLPLNGRNYLDLALLVPGVSRTNTGANQRFAETSAVPGTGLSVSSQRNLNNDFVVDGLSANDDAAELAGTFYSEDVIREFQVVRSGGIAEYGHSTAGVVSVVTQSGTNATRGDGYGFFRDDAFDARNALSPTKFPFSRQQYGASIGGPIVRDRTFFFGNFEQLREKNGSVVTIAPENVALINARLDAVGDPGVRVSTGNIATTLDTDNWFGRFDQFLSISNQLGLRYSRYEVSSSNARGSGGLNDVSRAAGLADTDQVVAASHVWTISPELLNEARAQWMQSNLAAPTNDVVGPAITIPGIANIGVATSSPTLRDTRMWQGLDALSLVRGPHSVKGGVEYLYNSVRIDFPGALQGVYTFRNLADFLAGRYTNYQQAFGIPGTTQNNSNAGAFLQDEWRISPRLTLNAGVRYDLQFLSRLVHTDTNNVSPRLGLAWDPEGDGRSVVRVSGGFFYTPIPLRAMANALQRDGVQYSVALVTPTSQTSPAPPIFPGRFDRFPGGILTNVTSIDPDIQSGESFEATAQYERQLSATATASVAYEHLRGRHIILSRNVNAPTTTDPAVFNLGRPDPTVANNAQYQSIGDSWYDGVTVAFTQRPVAWGSVRVAYTYSKAFDTAGNFFFSTPQNNDDIAGERGRSDNDQRHRLTISGTATSPASVTGSLWGVLASNWSVTGIFTYASALPYNPVLAFDRNGDTNLNDRPAGVPRNAASGFDFESFDVRLTRRIPLGSDVALEAIVEAFNVFNRKNYQVPNPTIGSPTFGQPTAVNDPRQLQFGLRVSF
jgi:outer membrane receptor protein involved in Fe transport